MSILQTLRQPTSNDYQNVNYAFFLAEIWPEGVRRVDLSRYRIIKWIVAPFQIYHLSDDSRISIYQYKNLCLLQMCSKIMFHLVGKDENWPSSIPTTTADLQSTLFNRWQSMRMRTTLDIRFHIRLIVERALRTPIKERWEEWLRVIYRIDAREIQFPSIVRPFLPL